MAAVFKIQCYEPPVDNQITWNKREVKCTSDPATEDL